jgi:ribulose-phosphate 3-epimerase
LTIDKVKNLRRLVPRAIIEVDGGINETNIKTLKNAGADLICAGSALVKAPNMLEAWDRLHEAMG